MDKPHDTIRPPPGSWRSPKGGPARWTTASPILVVDSVAQRLDRFLRQNVGDADELAAIVSAIEFEQSTVLEGAASGALPISEAKTRLARVANVCRALATMASRSVAPQRALRGPAFTDA